MAKQRIQQIRRNSKPGPLSITHLSLCVHISIRIGHRQQENIRFLQDGGDDWVLPVVRCDLSRDKKRVGDARAGWGARSRPVYLPQMPLCSLPAALIDPALCKALGALQNLGTRDFMRTSTFAMGPGLPGLFIPSRRWEQGREEPHTTIVRGNLGPHATG